LAVNRTKVTTPTEAGKYLSNCPSPLVADTSVVINLIATGFASSIIGALPQPFVVVDVVPSELAIGRGRGRMDFEQFDELVNGGIVKVFNLGHIGMQHFEGLVIGAAAETLDDGEAATIACAIEQSGVAYIDERKAWRICSERYPALRVGCTVDLLTHADVRAQLSDETVADAIFNALQRGRMSVLPTHFSAVVSLIGAERAALCESLPRSIRVSAQKPAV
jgi:predicted nucleic acid-binding protein